MLKWYVYECKFNSNKIKVYNIFDHCSFNADVVKYLKKYKDKEEFAEKLKGSLMYYFWSKCEWEIILSSWPTYISVDELNRLNEESEEIKEKYKREPRRLNVNLETKQKIDVYSQVMNNWDVFLDYVWNSKTRRPRKEYADWEYRPLLYGDGKGGWVCNKCGSPNKNIKEDDPNIYELPGTKFCPNCGLPIKKGRR